MNLTQIQRLNAELEKTNKLTKDLAKQTLIVAMTSVIQTTRPPKNSTSSGDRNE